MEGELFSPSLTFPPHTDQRWGEDKLMNTHRALQSCRDKQQKGPADTREAGCQLQLPDLSTHPDPSKSSPWLLKDLSLRAHLFIPNPICYLYIAKFISEHVNTLLKRSDIWGHAPVVVHREAQTQLHSWKSRFKGFSQQSLTQQLGWQTHIGKPPASPFCYHSHFISVLLHENLRVASKYRFCWLCLKACHSSQTW